MVFAGAAKHQASKGECGGPVQGGELAHAADGGRKRRSVIPMEERGWPRRPTYLRGFLKILTNDTEGGC